MSMKGGGFDRKSKASSEVPSSSLADIAFLLLIFFMVMTVFQSDRDRPIEPDRQAYLLEHLGVEEEGGGDRDRRG